MKRVCTSQTLRGAGAALAAPFSGSHGLAVKGLAAQRWNTTDTDANAKPPSQSSGLSIRDLQHLEALASHTPSLDDHPPPPPPAPPAPPAAISKDEIRTLFPAPSVAVDGNGYGENPHIRPDPQWGEPSLTELDISIPHVDIHFMTDLITKRYAYKTELWDLIDKHRKNSPLGEEKAKKIPAVKFLKAPAVIMSDDEYNKLTAAHEHEAADFKKRNVSKALIEGLEFDDGVTLIDCRTVNEASVWGVLEGAKIVPIHDMWEGLKMHPALFEAEFGFRKPRQYDKIVFYCHHGPRSLMAAQFAWFMGWRNVYTFKEGYYHWAKQYSKILRSWFEHDERTGNDRHRQVQFIIGREISRDIAKEVNPRISKELESLMIDQTRSRGTVKAIACSSRALDPNPSPILKLLPEAEAKALPNLEDVFLPTHPGYQQDVIPETKIPEIPELPPGMKLPPGVQLPLPPGPAKPRRVDDMSKPSLRYAGNYYDVVTAPVLVCQ